MRKLARLLATGLLAAAAVTVVAGPARAAGVDATCTGTFNGQYSPARTNSPQTIQSTTSSSYNPCVVGPSSGASTVAITVHDATCTNILTAFEPFDEVVTWSGVGAPTTSTIHYTNVVTLVSTVAFQGTVTAGRFSGDVVQREVQTTGLSGTGTPSLCPLGPSYGTLTGVSGEVVALTIESL